MVKKQSGRQARWKESGVAMQIPRLKCLKPCSVGKKGEGINSSMSADIIREHFK